MQHNEITWLCALLARYSIDCEKWKCRSKRRYHTNLSRMGSTHRPDDWRRCASDERSTKIRRKHTTHEYSYQKNVYMHTLFAGNCNLSRMCGVQRQYHLKAHTVRELRMRHAHITSAQNIRTSSSICYSFFFFFYFSFFLSRRNFLVCFIFLRFSL